MLHAPLPRRLRRLRVRRQLGQLLVELRLCGLLRLSRVRLKRVSSRPAWDPGLLVYGVRALCLWFTAACAACSASMSRLQP